MLTLFWIFLIRQLLQGHAWFQIKRKKEKMFSSFLQAGQDCIECNECKLKEKTKQARIGDKERGVSVTQKCCLVCTQIVSVPPFLFCLVFFLLICVN